MYQKFNGKINITLLTGWKYPVTLTITVGGKINWAWERYFIFSRNGCCKTKSITRSCHPLTKNVTEFDIKHIFECFNLGQDSHKDKSWLLITEFMVMVHNPLASTNHKWVWDKHSHGHDSPLESANANHSSQRKPTKHRKFSSAHNSKEVLK